MVIIEKSFPRGGVAQIAPTVEKKDNIIFGATQKKTGSKKHAKKSKNEEQDEEDRIEISSAELINYQSVQDGMVIMGIVKDVDEICVKISLPGRITVKVLALSISDAYTKNISEFVANPENCENYKPLVDMYQVGQIVYGKVMEVKEKGQGLVDIDFSLKPNNVHSELVHTNIKKGFVFNGAIEEVQEHGYIIETGIKSLRCFLPIEKSEPGHAVGELIFMKVEELKQQPAATTIRCKEVQPSKLKIKDQIDPNLDYLLPGAIVNFTVEKLLKDGLQGTIMNGAFTGYINENCLKEALDSVDDIEVNSNLSARILYVAPLTKFVYLSLDLFLSDENSTVYKKGEVVKRAAVHHIGKGGVVVILDNKYKGFISLRSIKANQMGNFDMDQILNKYTKKSKHDVRILDYDLVGRFYVCTDDPVTVNEKVFTVSDISTGEIVTATVVDKNKKIGGYALKIGNVKGAIQRFFLSPSTTNLAEKSKVKCRVVSINSDRNLAYLTNLPEYLQKNSKVLTTIDDAKVGRIFMGTVVKCNETYALIKFFNDIKGILYQSSLNDAPNLYEGQTMHFRIKTRTEENIVLDLPESNFQLGELCQATVNHVMDSGLEIEVQSKIDDHFNLKALIPDHLISEFPELAAIKLKTYTIGQEIKACCITKNQFSIRDVSYFQEGTIGWSNVQVGDIIRSFVKNVDGEVIEIMVPIKGYKKVVKVHRKMALMKSVDPSKIVMVPEQVIYVKILSKELTTKTIAVSAILTEVWNGDLTKTGEYFNKYLQEIAEIKKSLKKQGNPIGKMKVGEKVSAKLQGINEDTGDWLMEVEKNNVIGVIKKSLQGKQKTPKEGVTVECVVLWIDFPNNLVYLSSNPGEVNRITSDKKIPENLANKTDIDAKVILKLENLVICSIKKGQNPLVYIPTRLHYNDFEAGSTNVVNEGDFCKISFILHTHPIAVLDKTYKLWHDMQKLKRKLEEKLKEEPAAKKLKKPKVEQKLEQNKEKLKEEPAAKKVKKPKVEQKLEQDKEKLKEEPTAKKVKKPKVEQKLEDAKLSKDSKVDSFPMFYEDRVANPIDVTSPPPPKPQKRTLEQKRTPLQIKGMGESIEVKKKPDVKEEPLPGATNFWSTDIITSKPNESSSEDEDEENKEPETKKKKKQTTAEKYKAAREEEARLREIEEKYANPNILPETTDQFDRLVLSEPNDSKNWINYMVYHLQAMEIDKARAVARRALKSISFRESEELLNIWVALLNLELRYGTKENFNDVLKESLMSNDQLKIYMRVLEILTEANKTQELVDLIGIISKKFKDNLDMWKACAIAFYKVGIHDRAQQMMHKALAVLPEREHVNTIVAFANLTHKYSKNPETAHALLDQVVTSYPKRVDVWSQLVDMLVKDNQIESARRTLERAVIQTIPLKKMRTIFKKFMEFEERHGTPENVEKVKASAAEYVKKHSV